MVFYVYYEGKTLIKNQDAKSFSELVESIKSHFKLDSFEIKYLDTDNEKINLDSQEEFEWMIDDISEIELFVSDILHSKTQTHENIEIKGNEILKRNSNAMIEKDSSRNVEEEKEEELEEIDEKTPKLPNKKSQNSSEIKELIIPETKQELPNKKSQTSSEIKELIRPEMKEEELIDEHKILEDEIKKIIKETFEKEFLSSLTYNIFQKLCINPNIKHHKQIEANLSPLRKEDQEKEIMEKKIVHENSICFLCKITPIIGIKYKCPICIDREYCSNCEGNLYHEHNLLKIKTNKKKTEKPVHLEKKEQIQSNQNVLKPEQAEEPETNQNHERNEKIEEKSEQLEGSQKMETVPKIEILQKNNENTQISDTKEANVANFHIMTQSEKNFESFGNQEAGKGYLFKEKGAEFFLSFGEIEIIPKKFDILEEEIIIKFEIFNESDKYLEHEVFVRLSPSSYLKGDVVEIGNMKKNEVKKFEMKVRNPNAIGKHIFSLQLFEKDYQSELILKESPANIEFQVTKPVSVIHNELEIINKAIFLNECCFNDRKNINDCLKLVLENKDLDTNQLIEKFLNFK